jgi:hypothetical protein
MNLRSQYRMKTAVYSPMNTRVDPRLMTIREEEKPEFSKYRFRLLSR